MIYASPPRLSRSPKAFVTDTNDTLCACASGHEHALDIERQLSPFPKHLPPGALRCVTDRRLVLPKRINLPSPVPL
jgi:hypothetical protein